MDKRTIDFMRGFIKYNRNRKYFGDLVFREQQDTFGKFKRTQNWDDPITQDVVRIGHINEANICRTLWYQASYNPVRFGTKSPFVYNGTEDLYHFCKYGVSKDFPGYDVWEKVRNLLAKFLQYNGDSDVSANHGLVRVKIVYGRPNDSYMILSLLRQALRTITNTNREDLDRSDMYRVPMLDVIKQRHPNEYKKFIEGLKSPVKNVVAPITENVADYTEDEEQTYKPQPYEYDTEESEGDNDIMEIEIDKHWKKTGVMLSTSEYKQKQFDNAPEALLAEYQQMRRMLNTSITKNNKKEI